MTPSSATTRPSSARSCRCSGGSEPDGVLAGLGRLPRAPNRLGSGTGDLGPDDLADDFAMAVVFFGWEVVAPPAADRLHQQQAPAAFDIELRLSGDGGPRAAVADLHDQLPPVGG